jgi:hypothetical protein
VDEDGTGSVAFIGWALDDGSGRAPGIQTITDDFAFPVQNCIMASGERESEQFPGTILPKNCSDAPGSSKRFFLEVTEADTPIDLVFNTGMGVLRYKGVRDPSEDGGEAFEEFRDTYGIGRIYRVIMKFLNETDERIAGIRVEVGTGVGDDFEELNFEDDGVALELRELVEREFFVGNTGAGPREVWDPVQFAQFARKFFHDGSGRFPLGFMDFQPAGLFPAQSVSEEDDQAQFIYTGETLNPDTGIYGALTQNYFSIAEKQGGESDLANAVLGYMLPGALSPFTIARHDDGNPLTESDATVAWWDGNIWRYGLAEDFAEVPESQLQQWAGRLLGLDTDDSITGPERFESVIADDLSAVNMDPYLRIEDIIVGEDGLPRYDSITLRLTAVSVDSLGIGDAAGTEDPLWVQPGNEAPELASYLPETGTPLAINDFAETLRNEDVEIEVLANDLLDGEAVPNEGDTTVVIDSQPANGTATVEPTTNVVTYTPDESYVGEDTFTYTVEYDDGETIETSNVATVTVQVNAPEDPSIPVAANDSGSTIEDEPITIDVIANDTVGGVPIIDGPEVVVEILDPPVNGTVVVNEDKTITYTANSDANFSFVERFTYTVTVDGAESNAALVTVRAELDETLLGPQANDDSADATGTEPVIIDVLANDTYNGEEVPEDVTVTVAEQPGNGTVMVNTDGTITYTADEGFEGDDTFTYNITVSENTSEDATVTVAVSEESSSGGSSGGGGCTTTAGKGAPIAAILLVLGVMAHRRRKQNA